MKLTVITKAEPALPKIEKIGEMAKEMIKNKGFYRMFRNKLVNFVADF